MLTFYDRFVDLCKEHNISQVIALEKVGMSSGNLSYYKKGKLPKHKSLEGLAELFNVPINYLTGETDIKNEPDDPEIAELRRILANVDEEGKQKILEDARALLAEQRKEV